jgi:hypothetical protein
VPRGDGGLGLKCLPVQNQCLLLKLLHRLFHPAGSAWAIWVRHQVNLITLEGDVEGSHSASLCHLLPTYNAMATVAIRDRASTSFWNDSWLPKGPLSELLLALHSHATCPALSVAMALRNGVDAYLQRRLTREGAADVGGNRARRWTPTQQPLKVPPLLKGGGGRSPTLGRIGGRSFPL